MPRLPHALGSPRARLRRAVPPGRFLRPLFLVGAGGAAQALYGVFFADAARGWAVGSGGTILHTADAGAAWSPLSHSCTTRPLRAMALDATSGTAFAVTARGPRAPLRTPFFPPQDGSPAART